MAHAGAEDGQGQARHILVGPERGGEKAEDQRGQRSRQKGAQDAHQHGDEAAGSGARRLFIVEHAAKAQGAAHEHDALHAQVQVAGLLRQNLAQGAEQQRRAVGDGGDDEGQKQAQEITHSSAASLWLFLRKISL